MSNTNESTFTLGTSVTWTSQSSGYVLEKTGFIVECVPAKGYPSRERFPQLYKSSGVGMCRDHESYVVRVPGKTTKSQGKIYWPRVNGLSVSPPQKN